MEQSIQYIGALTQPLMEQSMDIIRPIVEQAGLELVGIERIQEGTRHRLWVYLDHPDGVNLDHCALVTEEISAAIDVVDPIIEPYELCVSSLGLDRPLLSDRDFREHEGRLTQIKLMSPLRGRRKFTGRIISMTNDLKIECQDGVHDLPLSLIHRARLQHTDAELKAILKARKGR